MATDMVGVWVEPSEVLAVMGNWTLLSYLTMEELCQRAEEEQRDLETIRATSRFSGFDPQPVGTIPLDNANASEVVAEDTQRSVREVLWWAVATKEMARAVKESKGAIWAIEKVMRETFEAVKMAECKAATNLVENRNRFWAQFKELKDRVSTTRVRVGRAYAVVDRLFHLMVEELVGPSSSEAEFL
ncbi:hypothetical protein ABZP36_027920 [Zizania latifolia]